MTHFNHRETAIEFARWAAKVHNCKVNFGHFRVYLHSFKFIAKLNGEIARVLYQLLNYDCTGPSLKIRKNYRAIFSQSMETFLVFIVGSIGKANGGLYPIRLTGMYNLKLFYLIHGSFGVINISSM